MKSLRNATIVMASALVLVACNDMSVEKPEIHLSVSETSAPVFTASLADISGTRVGMNKVDDAYKTYWEEGDEVLIVSVRMDGETPVVAYSYYEVIPQINSAIAHLIINNGSVEPVEDAEYYYAYYPSDCLDLESGAVCLPSQVVDFENPALPMYAESSSTNLYFTNLCSVLQFNLSTKYDSAEIESVRICSGEKGLSGQFCIVDNGNGDIPYLEEDMAFETTKCIEGAFETPLLLSSDAPTSIFFMLPVNTYEEGDLSLELTAYGCTKVLTLQKELSLNRAEVTAFDLNIDFWQSIGTGMLDVALSSFYTEGSISVEIEQLFGSMSFRVNTPKESFFGNNDDYLYLTVLKEAPYVSFSDYSLLYVPDLMRQYISDRGKNVISGYQVNGLPESIVLKPEEVITGPSTGYADDGTITITFPTEAAD